MQQTLSIAPDGSNRLGITFKGGGNAGDLFIHAEGIPDGVVEVTIEDLGELEQLLSAAAAGEVFVGVSQLFGSAALTSVRFEETRWCLITPSNHEGLSAARMEAAIENVAPKSVSVYDDGVKSRLLTVIASIFLVAFGGVWLYIAIKTFGFEPTDEQKTLTFGNGLVAVAGLIASTVTAGTAAVLGIEVQKSSGSAAVRVANATTASPIIWAGVLVYLLVGILNLWAWLANEAVAPEMVGVFGMSVLGWLAGAFLAVFKAE